jgi:hypothetical protein
MKLKRRKHKALNINISLAFKGARFIREQEKYVHIIYIGHGRNKKKDIYYHCYRGTSL